MPNEPKNSFQMGQIIYLLSEKAEKIVPAIVIEEVLVKKLDGNSVSWKVAVGPQGQRKEIDSNRLKGEIYCSLDEIKEVMTARLSEFVDNLLSDAQNKTEFWYGRQLVQPVQTSGGGKIDPASLLDGIDNTQISNHGGEESSQIGDLQNIKIKARPASGPLKADTAKLSTKDILRKKYSEKLVELATPSDEEMETKESPMGDFVIDSSGQRLPVKYNTEE